MVRILETTRGRLLFGGDWFTYPNSKDGRKRATLLLRNKRPQRVAKVSQKDALFIGTFTSQPRLNGRLVSGALAFAEYARSRDAVNALLLLTQLTRSTAHDQAEQCVLVEIRNGVPVVDVVDDLAKGIQAAEKAVTEGGDDRLQYFCDSPDAISLVRATPITLAEIAKAATSKAALSAVGIDVPRVAMWSFAAVALVYGGAHKYNEWRAEQQRKEDAAMRAQQQTKRIAELRAEFERAVSAALAAGGPQASIAGPALVDIAMRGPARADGWLVSEVKCSVTSCTSNFRRAWSTHADLVAKPLGEATARPALLGYALNTAAVDTPVKLDAPAVDRKLPRSRQFLLEGGSVFQLYLDAGMTAQMQTPAPVPVIIPNADPGALAALQATAPLVGGWTLSGPALYASEMLKRLPANMSLTELVIAIDGGGAVRMTAKGAFYVDKD
jgi:Pilin accessory protein (PilO)